MAPVQLLLLVFRYGYCGSISHCGSGLVGNTIAGDYSDLYCLHVVSCQVPNF